MLIETVPEESYEVQVLTSTRWLLHLQDESCDNETTSRPGLQSCWRQNGISHIACMFNSSRINGWQQFNSFRQEPDLFVPNPGTPIGKGGSILNASRGIFQQTLGGKRFMMTPHPSFSKKGNEIANRKERQPRCSRGLSRLHTRVTNLTHVRTCNFVLTIKCCHVQTEEASRWTIHWLPWKLRNPEEKDLLEFLLLC
jgi:hypothetical protein